MTAGAALLLGPLRALVPVARADLYCRDACQRDAEKETLKEFDDCVRAPLRARELYAKAFANRKEQLAKTTDRRRRRRLLAIIDQILQGEERALRRIEDCNFRVLGANRAARYAGCDLIECGNPAKYPPPPTPPAPPTPSGDCPPMTFSCAGVPGVSPSQCCFMGTYCCPCACCVYMDCRCCP
jgi:hypothetical protein